MEAQKGLLRAAIWDTGSSRMSCGKCLGALGWDLGSAKNTWKGLGETERELCVLGDTGRDWKGVWGTREGDFGGTGKGLLRD